MCLDHDNDWSCMPVYCHDGVCYHNEAVSACYTAQKGHMEQVNPIQSLVINMAINAYPTITGGVTIQYNQILCDLSIVRTHRWWLLRSVRAKRHNQCLKALALTMKEEHTCANVKAGSDASRITWLSIKTGLVWAHDKFKRTR
jgi:hypothetical protein